MEFQPWIPLEFTRRMRHLRDLPYWKATKFRLFLLYVGVVLLKSPNTIEKKFYRHFLKFSCAMRILLINEIAEEDLRFCKKLLILFVNISLKLYGKGFVSYNVHSLIHLPEDFEIYGPLDRVSAFPSKSFLGVLTSKVKSGYKSLQQIAFYAHHSNQNAYLTLKSFKQIVNEKTKPTVLPENAQIPGATYYEKANLRVL